jgi:hypothetical protein
MNQNEEENRKKRGQHQEGKTETRATSDSGVQFSIVVIHTLIGTCILIEHSTAIDSTFQDTWRRAPNSVASSMLKKAHRLHSHSELTDN